MKRVIIILLILVVLGIPAYLLFNSQQSQDDFYTQLNHFNDLLKNQEYDEAKALYNEASSGLKANYNISLDSYAHDLTEEAKRLDTTQDTLDLLYTYHDIGYQSSEIDNAILYYEDLLQSNYIYLQGLEYYNIQDFESAMDCFRDVLEYDENYQNAQEYINSYQEYMLAWNEAKENSQYGRSPYPSAIAYKDSYMYIPYQFTNSVAILKIHATSYTVLSFPIVSTKYGAKISNLNIVGNYIFFLLENCNPLGDDGNSSAVYRISLSGGGLTKIADCDYTYLITYEDSFYALSESKGIVKIDSYFVNEEILVDEQNTIIDMQLVEGGISYTAQDAESDNNIQYFFDGETIEEVKKEVDMHYYDYGDDNLIYYDASGFNEYFYHENMATGTANNNQIYAGELYKYYGMLNNSAIFTTVGDYQQECIRVRDLTNYRVTYKAEKNKISYRPIGICYNTGTILLMSDSGISFTKEDMRIYQTIPLPHINSSVLTENEESVTSMEDEGFITVDTQITIDEDTWIYSDEMVNIRTEKVFLDYIESTVYISNIYTNDYRWLQSTSTDSSAQPIDAASGMVWAAAGQAYNEEPVLINDNRGIISQDVYVYNDDGMFIPYRADNVIPAEKITNAKGVYVFSLGDIILENYEVTSDALKTTVFDGRSAIGMIEPGHYIYITAEKSSKTNRGISMYTLANLFKDYGCISAFCFDSDYYISIFDGEYIYEDDKNSDYIRKYNEVLYYSGE